MTPTVMILEPDVLMRMILSEHLRACGFRVIEGVKGSDVWVVIDAEVKLDVVFSRVQLAAGESAFALASKLRQTHPGIDVILVSGATDAAEKSVALCERGPTKGPYRAEAVVRRIQQLVARRHRSLKRKGA